MSIRRGNKIIASRISNGFSLFDCKWADHILNNISWLRADTFSWQSGNVYKAAYEHLAGDLDTVQKLYCWIGEKMGDKYYTYSENPSVGETTTDGEAIKSIDSYGRPVVGADYLERCPEGDMLSTQTDTIGDITITYYLADDGHKICLPDQESNLASVYENTGVAWYYIIDSSNKQFKLPRTKFGFTGIRSGVGGYVEPGLPNITGDIQTGHSLALFGNSGTGALQKDSNTGRSVGGSNGSYSKGFTFDASRSNSIYGNSETVQQPATEMYLYFYVGNYVEDITTIDAGKLTEVVNDFDIDTFKSEVDEVRNEAISDINQTTSDSVTQLKNMGEVVNYTNITNCITEIPQDIKLELSDGVLTLKTGSKAYLPNGSGVFDVITILSDKTLTNVTNGTYVVCVTGGGGLIQRDISKCVSGETRPLTTTYMLWYDRTNNVINNYGSDSSTPAHTASLPIAIITVTDGAISSIDQVFNGFGYIGSTIFALPGVKALIPDGRNEDGTLKNRNMTVQSVLTKTIPSNTGWHYMTFNSIGTEIDVATNYYTGTELPSGATSYSRFYNTAENSTYTVVSGKLTKFPQFILDCYIDHSTSSPYKINSMKQATAFNVVDYNDTGFIANQAFPSNKYIDLTLGATGTTYTAPGDGTIVLQKSGNAGQYITIDCYRNKAFYNYSAASQSVVISLQVSKGYSFVIWYDASGATERFSFIYANGSK